MSVVNAHLVALERAGAKGFTPIGWLYTGIMNELHDRRLVHRGVNGTYTLSELGKEELARQRMATEKI